MSLHRFVAAIGLLTLVTEGLLAAPAATAATAVTAVTAPHGPLPVIEYRPTPHVSTAATATPSVTLPGGLPVFTATVGDNGTNYNYTMVGKNPAKLATNPVTSVKTYLVPLVIQLSNGHVYDPQLSNGCDSTPALTRVTSSLLFKKAAWTMGGTAVGTSQYVGAFRRAEFWQYTSPTGVNPSYDVHLTPTVLPAVTLTVPAGDSSEYATTCTLASININWLDSALQTSVIPSLSSEGVGPKTLPLFILNNVVEYTDNTVSHCCVLGYHSALNVPSGIQTYGIGDYENSGGFGTNVLDASVLAHEIGEWMDDPLGNNPTAPWGNIGQVTGCQNNLEVGDPLSGTLIARRSAAYNYHYQELAFFSWFYHQSPSLGVNGWYSDNGTFTTPAAACP